MLTYKKHPGISILCMLCIFKVIKSLTLYSMFHYKSTLYHLPPRVLVSILGLLTPSAEAAAAMKK